MKNNYYPIFEENKDFYVQDDIIGFRGTRRKKQVRDTNKNKAFLKYSKEDYVVSELVSEKLCYEIAKILGYNCARIEFAIDKLGNQAILNYYFIDKENKHTDAVGFLKSNDSQLRCEYYKISNIKNSLDFYNQNLFKEFIKIMIFDALVGEQDRHEENWGITNEKNIITMSPIYDNGCSLLDKFQDELYAEKYYNNDAFESFINKSKTYIYKEDKNQRYKHFELIKYLLNNYSELVIPEITNLNKLSNSIVKSIVNRVPDSILTGKHKEYIVKYIIRRRDILLNMLESAI